MNQSNYRVKTWRWQARENATTCFTFSCLTCGRSQLLGGKCCLRCEKTLLLTGEQMLIILSVFCSYMISNLFCVCKGDKKKKKKSGSGSSTSSNSRSSTPTIATDGAANTIAAAATKLSQDRPGTPCKYIPTIFRVRR